MQVVTIQRRIESLPTLSRSGKRINGLHRLMRSPFLFERSYEKVSQNKGALTPGVDGKTFDGMSLAKLADLARRVAEGTYRFRPVRRVYIPKGNGKTRPLGIPTVEDRLVQEAVRTILEAIYEPVFLDESHGFRPRRSCHTALNRIKKTWTGCKWLIEVDAREVFLERGRDTGRIRDDAVHSTGELRDAFPRKQPYSGHPGSAASVQQVTFEMKGSLPTEAASGWCCRLTVLRLPSRLDRFPVSRP